MNSVLTTAIDLAQLPEVEYVPQLTHDQITVETIQWLRDEYDMELAGPEAPDYRIIRACNYREMLLRQQYNRACLNLTLKHATGEYLDHIGMTYHRTVRLPDEGDAAYRQRIALSPEAVSVAGPDGAYVWHVLNVDPSIRGAKAHELAEGQVGIYVLTNSGELSDDLQARIESVFNDQSIGQPQAVRPIAIRVSVLPCQMLDYAINARLILAGGVAADEVKAHALAAIQAYTNQQMQIGGRVVRSFLDHHLHVPGVIQVTLTGWHNIEATLTQAPRCTAIHITTEVGA